MSRRQRFRVSGALRTVPGSIEHPGGFSLLEVIIATAMLMGAAVVLSRLAGMGREQSQAAETLDTAQRLCEQTLNELLLGARPLVAAEDQPLVPLDSVRLQPAEPVIETPAGSFAVPGAAAGSGATDAVAVAATIDAAVPWRYSVRMQPQAAFPGMWILTVEVADGDQQLVRRRRLALTRWISGPAPAGAFENPFWQRAPEETLQP